MRRADRPRPEKAISAEVEAVASAHRAKAPAPVGLDLRETDLLVLQGDGGGARRVVALSLAEPSKKPVPVLRNLASTAGVLWGSRALERMMFCGSEFSSKVTPRGERSPLKLWVADKSGTSAVYDLAHGTSEALESGMSISATGAISVVTGDVSSPTLSIIRVDRIGQGAFAFKERRLHEETAWQLSKPVWNPRSEELAYLVLHDEVKHEIRLWHKKQLASFRDALRMVWSTDGKRLSYVVAPGYVERGIRDEETLCCVNVDGTVVKRLLRRKRTRFVPLFFLNDPYRIIYAEARFDAARYGAKQMAEPEVHWRCVEVDTGEVTHAFPFRYAGVLHADLQPGPNRLVFFGDGVNWRKSAIVQYRIGDRHARVLANVPEGITPTSWSIRWAPDGEGVVFSGRAGGVEVIYHVPPGGGVRKLCAGMRFDYW